MTAGPPSTIVDHPGGWPRFDPPPRAAFIDVDGTLLAETTTYLFARILRQRGLIRRSFVPRALYHGLQHRFGRLDYGRLGAFGLRSISSLRGIEPDPIAYENSTDHTRPAISEGAWA